MQRGALSLLLLAACAPAQDTREHPDVSRACFTSTQAVLLAFELDGTLYADTNDDASLRTSIKAQLMFTIGQLNGDNSVGRFERLELSNIQASSTSSGRYQVAYHAKLPVAWAGATKPTVYSLTLPASVAEQDLATFAARYSASCMDPSGGAVEAGRMFLFFRPHMPGCNLAAADVVTTAATVTASAGSTHGKYPEYDRVWSDGALEVAAIFSRELHAPTDGDWGVGSYDAFVSSVRSYIRELQPTAAERTEPASSTGAITPRARFAAELPDGRRIVVSTLLVSDGLADEGAAFDAWYDGVTPSADLVLYNGHAGLGANVRTLMNKGTFRSGQYLIWVANSCDTFAYVDRTLVDRRAALNPDDPGGTKYLDTVTNVMGPYFGTFPDTAMTFLRALVEARDPQRAPKTYEQIVAGIDPDQVIVVTGEEDNQFEPAAPAVSPTVPETAADPAATAATKEAPPPSPCAASGAPPPHANHGCGVGAGPRDAGYGAAVGIVLALLAWHRKKTAAEPRFSAGPP